MKSVLHRLISRSRRFRRRCQQKLIWRMDNWLFAAQGSSRRWMRQLFIRPLFELRRIAKLVFDGLRLRVVLLKGYAVDSQAFFTVAYIGEGDGLNFLQYSLFAEDEAEREQRGRCFVWRAPVEALAFADEVDMVILERNSLFSWRSPFGEWHIGPPWVRMVRDFEPGEDWQQVKDSMRHQRDNIRCVRRGGYTYRISHDEADFDHFYNHMYVPFISARHQGYAIISDQAYLRSFFRRGMLMVALSKGERPVAMLICIPRGEVLYMISLGVLDGDPKWMRNGAVSALYYYSYQWAHEHGMRRVDAGRCRPFLTDGLFSHKERWGLCPEQGLWVHSEWLFWVPNGSPAAQAWLRAHFFVPSVSQSAMPADAAFPDDALPVARNP